MSSQREGSLLPDAPTVNQKITAISGRRPVCAMAHTPPATERIEITLPSGRVWARFDLKPDVMAGLRRRAEEIGATLPEVIAMAVREIAQKMRGDA